MKDNTLTLPVGNGMTLRLQHEPAYGSFNASLHRGRYPNGPRVAFFVLHSDETSRIRLDKCRSDGASILWLSSANVELTPTAAQRIAAWLGSRLPGITSPAEAGGAA